MQTSVIMFRPEEGTEIRQDSKNTFFNANDLLNLFNTKNSDTKRIQNYLDNEATKRYINVLVRMDDLEGPSKSELGGTVLLTKGGKNGGTWMHPYLFIDFAMWLSPEFKAKVVKWVYDNLIKFRLEAGDSFKDVNEALFELKPNSPPYIYASEATMINKIVFGNPARDQRNSATEKQLELLKTLQKADVKLIHDGVDYYDRYEKLRELKKYLV